MEELPQNAIQQSTSKYFVLGYCRSTFGGYDVWTDEPETYNMRDEPEKKNIGTLRLAPNTTINRMNYAGLVCCLESILNTHVPPPHLDNLTNPKVPSIHNITIVCGCFIVCQHMSGGYQSTKLRTYYLQAKHILDELATHNTTVRLVYDPAICAPK